MEAITNILKEILESNESNGTFTIVDKNGKKVIKFEKDKELYITNVIFSESATTVFWSDSSKTVVKAQNGEPFDKEKGLAMAIIKKLAGNTGAYNELFKEWC